MVWKEDLKERTRSKPGSKMMKSNLAKVHQLFSNSTKNKARVRFVSKLLK